MPGSAESPIPWVISADDHVVEPPHLWETWLPAKYHDRGPRVEPAPTTRVPAPGGGDGYVRGGDGPIVDWWIFEDLVRGTPLVMACVGSRRTSTPCARSASTRCARVAMTPTRASPTWTSTASSGRCASRTFPRFAGQMFLEAKDKDLALACVRAYNDWMIEEWCGDTAAASSR